MIKTLSCFLFALCVAAEPINIEEPSNDEYFDMAVHFLEKWEGVELKAYKDVVNVTTICMGHTKGVKMGDVKTLEECREILKKDITIYRAGLHKYFSDTTLESRLPPTRDVAYTSLAINVGIHGAGNSTATRRLNAGDIKGGCEALTWWNKAGGRVFRGLVRRRAEEKDLCLIGV